MKRLSPWMICTVLALAFVRPVFADELPTARPAEVGLSSSKLDAASAAVQKMIDKRQIAGAVTVVARDGKLADVRAPGMMDLEKRTAMKTDAIFRIYSMTKPITTVAAMILWEEG